MFFNFFFENYFHLDLMCFVSLKERATKVQLFIKLPNLFWFFSKRSFKLLSGIANLLKNFGAAKVQPF